MQAIQQNQFQKLLNRNVLFPIGFGLLSIILFVGIITYLLSLARWVEQSDVTINTANIMTKLMVDQETAMRGFVITRNEEYLQPYQRAVELLPATTAKLKRMLEGNETQTRRLETIIEVHRRWRDYSDRVIELRRNNTDAREAVSPTGKQLMDQIRNQSDALLAELADGKAAHTANARTLVVVLVTVLCGVCLLLSVVLAHLGRRQMISLASAYEKLLRDLDQQNAALHDEEWLRIGELGLAEQIIGQLPLPILCQNVLTYLAGRIDVLVGAVYVSHGEDTFRREANYGFSKAHAQREQQFALREGLIGQVAVENRIIHLSAAPSGYLNVNSGLDANAGREVDLELEAHSNLKVNSGLGEAAPLHVLLVPIRAETMMVAVLELGFFRVIERRDVEFLERVAENIGAAIVAAMYRRRLHDTLLEMQQLNDELQSQQEELRATNEELEEQSQALEESRQRLQSQHTELVSTNQALQGKNAALHTARGLLEERAQQLEQANRYKSEFLANMSHELRTPLNSALILSKLLVDNAHKNLTAEQVRFAGAIHSAGQDLLALINDVLDLSKVEAGKVDIIPDDISVVHIVETLRTCFEPVALEKNLEFALTIAPDMPQTIRTDRQRLEQILRNLLSNALKFTTVGGIRLSIDATDNDCVAFIVSDSGIGISADMQEAIFEPFHQIDSANNRKYGGAGLGLSISRDLARLLGGTLAVQSSAGAGSTFALTIPIEFSTEILPITTLALPAFDREESLTANVVIPIPDFEDDRENLNNSERIILVVEDEINFARIIYDLAHELHYKCLVATSAEEAFELATQYCPNAILLDMKLPDHSGLAVLSRLKEEPLTRHIPVHVLSVEERSSIALRMGAVSYALKPVTHEQLRALFADIEKNLANKMKTVLIVEDFAQHAENTARLIAGIDVNATTVATGAQALLLLKERVFDCMIIDYELPDMTASQLLASMTTTEICSFPPVIVHSSRNLSRAEEDDLLRHSHSIIIKGVRSSERLLDEVTLFLHRVETDLSAERQHALRDFRNRDRAFENRTILLVDDDVRNIFALTSVLEDKGARVATGRNGFDAIKRLNEGGEIDLVLMDIMMPEMDGYEAIEKIRQNRRFAKLPIIAVTAKAMRDDQERCLRVGANDYVAKPVNLERLMSLIRVWLPQVQRV